MEKIQKLVDEVLDGGSLVYLVLSNRRKGRGSEFRKVTARPTEARGRPLYQFEYHFPDKVTHRNLDAAGAKTEICSLLADTFKQGQLFTRDADVQVLCNRQGQVSILAKKPTRQPEPVAHNRRKQYVLPEGKPVDFLVRLGVMTAKGDVITAKYHKFRQINGYLEMVDDVAEHLEVDGTLQVVDFGCGKSYLTFGLYYYLSVVKGWPVHVVGLDVRESTVAECNQIARELGYEGLTFSVGDIAGYQGLDHADLVVTLHACDTATDDALAKAVRWGAHVIFLVPCCQHELFGLLESDDLRPLLKYGIIKERLAALVTDSLRAELLQVSGYGVQMLEFIDTEHTRKNILIRAVKQPATLHRGRQVEEYQRFRDFWGVRPYLEQALDLQAELANSKSR